MLYFETVSPLLQKTLIELMLIDDFKEYRLAGGTALSLFLGHRKSVDIDLFCSEYKSFETLFPVIKKHFPKAQINDIGFGAAMYIPVIESKNYLKVDFCSDEPFIRNVVLENGIRFAHTDDIAAMKLQAVSTRSEKKDFWDIAELLQKYTINQMLNLYKERYIWNDDLKNVITRLSQPEKCDNQPDPVNLNEKNWESVKTIVCESLDKYISNELL